MADIKKKKIIIISAMIILILAVPFILAFTSSYTVLIKNTHAKYYRANVILLARDSLICLKDSAEYRKKKVALAVSSHDYGFRIISMNDIVYMEIIPDSDEISTSKWKKYGIKYLGKYKADVSGNIGYLYLSSRRGKLYGSIRFPDWANGIFEPLKSLWISKGKIGFIRSVDTLEEAKRVGVSTFFTQEFYGDYKRKGNMIEGHYTSRGAKNAWRAFRMK